MAALYILIPLAAFALFLARCCREDRREKEIHWQAARRRINQKKQNR